MALSIIKDSGLFTLMMTGSVDINETDLMRTKIAEEATEDTPVEVNASEVTYIDSSGVALLLYVKKLAENKGVTFKITMASEAVQKVIKLAMLESLLPIDEVIGGQGEADSVSEVSFDDDLSESFSDIFDEPKDQPASNKSESSDGEKENSDDIFGNAGSDFK